jgi:hypothetical protein
VSAQGCVQEEIRFIISPELIVARLFTAEFDVRTGLSSPPSRPDVASDVVHGRPTNAW